MTQRPTQPRITVIVASLGRPAELGRWREHIARQTLPAVEVIWAVTADDDLPADVATNHPANLQIIRSRKGSAVQRNAALDAIRARPDLVAFFDDDYLPTDTCLEGMAAAFDTFEDAAGLTGTLLADGVNGPGLSYEAARSLIARHGPSARPPSLTFEPWEGLYGCNMALRAAMIGAQRFDERLKLYGWQEDVDFAIRVARGRPLGRTNGFAGVHQGVKGGRTSGKRFGYSQIANPAYLYRKGSMRAGKMFALAGKNFLSNHLKCLRPEPWVDRRGRVVGNWLALLDIARGRVCPERILDL